MINETRGPSNAAPNQTEPLDMSLKTTPQRIPFPPIVSPCYSSHSESDLSCSDLNFNSIATTGKTLRPFKALKSNLPPSPPADLMYDNTTTYLEFRQSILNQMKPANSTNKNMRRIQSLTRQITDPEYLEKRRKNNEAAKRSRDARRAKEDEMAIRCLYLEKENAQLRCRLATIEEENRRLFAMIRR